MFGAATMLRDFRWSRSPTPELLLGVLFLLAGLAAISATRSFDGLALIWPANGMAAAVLIRLRRVRWTVAALSLLAGGVLANALAGDAPLRAVALTMVNLAEIGAMVYTYRVLFPLPVPHLSIAQATHMTVLMGLAIPALAAVPGGLLLASEQDTGAWNSIREWWISDALGACMVAPAVLLYSRTAWQRLTAPRFVWLNAGLVLLCVAWTALAIRYVSFPFVVVGLLPLMAAFHVGGFGAAVLGLCTGLTVIGVWLAGVLPHGFSTVPLDGAGEVPPLLALLATLMPAMAVGLGTDVRRRIHQALAASERRFRESMDHSPIGMLNVDLQGQCTYSNQAFQQMLGYGPRDGKSLQLATLLREEDRTDVQASLARLLSGEVDSYTATRRYRHRDGSWVWACTAVSLARTDEGEPLHFVAQVESLQERRTAEAYLAAEREMLRITLASISDAVLTTDGAGRIAFVNDAACAVLDRRASELEGKDLDEMLPLTCALTGDPVNLGSACLRERRRIASRDAWKLERADGGNCYVVGTATPALDPQQALTGMIISLHDVTSSVEKTRQLEHRADHDPLTGLLNRAAFERQVHAALKALQQQERPAALIALDLDRFKAVNDSGGHAAGDAVLRAVAEMLRNTLRPTDSIGRLGGDEFAVLLRDCPAERATEVGRRLLQALNPLATSWQGRAFHTGASLGIAQGHGALTDVEAWMAAADAAAYQAKRSGRGLLRSAAVDAGATTLRMRRPSVEWLEAAGES